MNHSPGCHATICTILRMDSAARRAPGSGEVAQELIVRSSAANPLYSALTPPGADLVHTPGAFQAATAMRAKRNRQAAAGEKPVTRTASITIGLTLALSLSAGLFSYIRTPSARLTPRETMVIVGMCVGVVLAGRMLGPRLHAAMRSKVLTALLVAPLAGAPLCSAVAFAVDPSTLSSAPDRFLARPGESLRVRVWHAAAGSQAFGYSRSVDGGHIEGAGRGGPWTFGSVRPGYYKATVQIAEAIGPAAECSVRVVVVTADGSRGFETTRAFLAPSETEDPAFGLYSYLLLNSPPATPAIRQRWLASASRDVLTARRL